jgi:hypothetical protein
MRHRRREHREAACPTPLPDPWCSSFGIQKKYPALVAAAGDPGAARVGGGEFENDA